MWDVQKSNSNYLSSDKNKMTLIIGACGKEFLITGADSRKIDLSNNKIEDGVQKIFKLDDSVYFSYSGQKYLPAAILSNYEEHRIKQPNTFNEFLEAFRYLAIVIKEKTPQTLEEHQFVIFGYDEENNIFRAKVFNFNNNYEPQEASKFFALGQSQYIDWQNSGYTEILASNMIPRKKTEKLLKWMKIMLKQSFMDEKKATGSEPHVNEELKYVSMIIKNGKLKVHDAIK